MKCPKCQAANPAETRFCGRCGLDLRPSDFPTATMASSLHEFGRGSVIAGRYEVIEEIGAGGMGKVFKAYDRRMHEVVAVKTIRPEIGADAQALERFGNEIRLARRIAHKNVARMFDVGDDDGTPYITMEYVAGEDLRSLMQRIGLLPLAKTLALGRQIACGLSEAHALGIIHRDLKPHNIMIDREGNARIMDFGIARFVKTRRVTEAGVLLGTPEYMSPEQIEGGACDARSDLYALGVILYEMVTGRLPFQGDTPLSVAVKQKTAVPEAPLSLNAHTPPALNAAILKCLEKKPESRFATTEALAEALSAVERELSTAERVIPAPPSRPARDVTIKFNPRRVVLPVGMILLLAAAGLGIWIFLTKPGSPRAVPADRSARVAASKPAAVADPPVETPAPAEKTRAAQPVPVPEKAPVLQGRTEAQAKPVRAAPGPVSPAPTPLQSALERARDAWAMDRPAEAVRHSRDALSIDPANAEAAELLKLAEAKISERAILELVALYDKSLAEHNLPSFYSANCTAALASDVLKDAQTVSGLFARFRSTVANARIAWTGRDAAEVSFEHKLVGIPKGEEPEQVLFQGVMRWRVARQGDRWIIAGIASDTGLSSGSALGAGGEWR